MMKHLWLYPLLAGLMIAVILACTVHAGFLLYRTYANPSYHDALLVWEVNHPVSL